MRPSNVCWLRTVCIDRVHSGEMDPTQFDQAVGRVTDVDDRTVDVHVGRLRKAINIGRSIDPIRTVRGAGYSFG